MALTEALAFREHFRRPGARSARARLMAPLAAVLAQFVPVGAGAAPDLQDLSIPTLPTLGPFEEGAVVALSGTSHLWLADSRGTLHWGGDTRALQGRVVRGEVRVDVTLDQLKTLPRREPWLSSGLVKIGDPIFLSKWETTDTQPTLLHIQDIRDVELFGINASNYGEYVLTKEQWEARYGFRAESLRKAAMTGAATLCTTPAADQWREFTSQETGVAVYLPRGAELQSTTAVFADPPFFIGVTGGTVHRFAHATAVGVNEYLVGHVDFGVLESYSERDRASVVSNQLFAEFVASRAPRAHVWRQRTIVQGSAQGVEYRARRAEGEASFKYMRFCLVGLRAYLAMVQTPATTESLLDAARYLDSLRLPS